MALTGTVLDIQTGPDQIAVFVAVTPKLNYVVGGDTLDLTNLSNPGFLAKPMPSRQFLIPPMVVLEEMGGVYTGIIDSTSLATYKVKFYTGGGNEFAAATYASQAITLANFNVIGSGGMKLVIQLIWRTGT